jgi:hypothetical protein
MAASRSAEAPVLELAQVTAETFRPHLGSEFLLQRSGAQLSLTLAEVSALNTSPHAPRPGFLLRFLSAEPGNEGQGLYRLEHATLGPLELFLVPAGPAQGRMRYDAVFG